MLFQQIKKIDQNFLPCLLLTLSCLWYVLGFSGHFSAILTSFSGTVRKKNEMARNAKNIPQRRRQSKKFFDVFLFLF